MTLSITPFAVRTSRKRHSYRNYTTAMLYLLIILIVISLPTTLSTTLSPTTTVPCATPLSCALWNASIPIPDTQIPLSIATMTLSSLTCNHFVLTDATPSTPAYAEVAISLSGLGGTCSGKYYISPPAKHGLHGDFTATIGEGATVPSKLDLTVDLNVNDDTIQVSDCVSVITIPSETLIFTGSISADLVELFATPVAKLLTSKLSTDLCPPLQDAVSNQTTALLRQGLEELCK